MSKLKTKLANLFLGVAKKLDSKTVEDNMIYIPSVTQPFITYDSYHVDKLHTQYMVSEFQSNIYNKMEGYENFIEDRIPEMLSRGLAEEIMKVHKDEIKKTQLASMEGTLYELDVYMCKPQKKEASF